MASAPPLNPRNACRPRNACHAPRCGRTSRRPSSLWWRSAPYPRGWRLYRLAQIPARQLRRDVRMKNAALGLQGPIVFRFRCAKQAAIQRHCSLVYLQADADRASKHCVTLQPGILPRQLRRARPRFSARGGRTPRPTGLPPLQRGIQRNLHARASDQQEGKTRYRLEHHVLVRKGARVSNLFGGRRGQTPRVECHVPRSPSQQGLALRRGTPAEGFGYRSRLLRLRFLFVEGGSGAARAERHEFRQLSIYERMLDAPGSCALHLGSQCVGLRRPDKAKSRAVEPRGTRTVTLATSSAANSPG